MRSLGDGSIQSLFSSAQDSRGIAGRGMVRQAHAHYRYMIILEAKGAVLSHAVQFLMASAPCDGCNSHCSTRPTMAMLVCIHNDSSRLQFCRNISTTATSRIYQLQYSDQLEHQQLSHRSVTEGHQAYLL